MENGRTGRRAVALSVAVLAILMPPVIPASPVHASNLPGYYLCAGEPPPLSCPAYWHDTVMATVAASPAVGGTAKATAVASYPPPYWYSTETGWVASGITQVEVLVGGTVLDYGPKTSSKVSAAPSTSSVTWTPIAGNDVPGVGVPTSDFPVPFTFWITYQVQSSNNGVPGTGDGGGEVVVAANQGYTSWSDYGWDGYFAKPAGGIPKKSELPNGSNLAENAKCQCPQGEPVDTATGAVSETYRDLTIPGRGMPLAFTRTYNSVFAARDGPLGYGWTNSYAIRASVNSTTGVVTISQEDGSQVVFTPSGPDYTAPPRVLATLVKQLDGQYLFTRRARERFLFSPSGRLRSEQDPNGYTTTLSYGSGQLLKVTDPAGRNLTLTWSGTHIATLTDPIGRMLSFTYDGSGNLITATDVGGDATSFTYDGTHRLTSITDPRGATTTTSYDSSDRAISQTDALGGVTTFDYATNPRGDARTTVTDPAGHIRTYVYRYGELAQQILGDPKNPVETWTYGYDPTTAGLSSIIDPYGAVTTFKYDSAGNVISLTDPNGNTTAATYDALDDRTSLTDPNGITTSMTYDGQGNLLSASRPLTSTGETATTTYAYGDVAHPGDVTGTTDPTGRVWLFAYDATGNLASRSDPAGNTIAFAHNPIGWLSSSVSPKGNAPGADPTKFTTTYSQDAFGDIAKLTDPLGHSQAWSYDPDRNVVALTDADNNTTHYEYDLAGDLTGATRADGTHVGTTFNPDRTVAQQTDGSGDQTTYAYDAAARLASVTDPLGRVTTLTYISFYHPGGSSTGHELDVTDPSGAIAGNQYDAAGRLKFLSFRGPFGGYVTFNRTYDNNGRRTYMSDGGGGYHYSYDSLNRLVQVTEGYGAGTLQSAYSYDLAGRVTGLTYPGGNKVTRTYDATGRFASVADWTGRTTSFVYDRDGNLVRASFPGGASDATTYDRADRLTAIRAANGSGSFATFAYTRDPAGLVASETSTGVPGAGTIPYTYTPLSQVASAGSSVYAYDPADRPTTLGGASLAYDAASEVTSLTQGTSNTAFTFDTRGDRTQAAVQGGPTVALGYTNAGQLAAYSDGTTSATYAYDGDGLRISKTVNATTTQFVWDVSGGLPRILRAGTDSLVYGPGDLPVEQVDASNNARFFHQDQLGSTRALTDASGAVAGTASYDPWGRPTGQTGATTSVGFAGGYADQESGLVYLRSRYYDPATGQFSSVDPAVSRTRIPYTYAAGDPVNVTDPSGAAVFGTCTSANVLLVYGVYFTTCQIYDTSTNTAFTTSAFGKGWGLGAGVAEESLWCPKCESAQDLGGIFSDFGLAGGPVSYGKASGNSQVTGKYVEAYLLGVGLGTPSVYWGKSNTELSPCLPDEIRDFLRKVDNRGDRWKRIDESPGYRVP